MDFDGEDRRAYLGFIQATITRLSASSFQFKSWNVTLGTIVIGLLAKDNRTQVAWIAILPAFMFWALDAQFFQLEFRYRVLFDKAAQGEKATYDMSVPRFGVRELIRTMFWSSVCPVHIGVIVVAISTFLVGALNPANR